LTSYGTAGVNRRALEVVLQAPSGGVFGNAVFAGNSSEDPTYSLDMGGENGQADHVDGDIYSAGDIALSGDSEVTGMVRAGGSITGADGEEGVRQAAPDIAAMDYENNNDVDVMEEFLTGGSSRKYNAAGGYADELPEANPAHIFRVNPSDRTADTDSTEKDDFFLEDPYERVHVDRNQNGKDATHLTIAPDGNNAVYYIDGNLWLHNRKTYSFKFVHDEPNGIQVTFVVRGNIYFSDNLFYTDPTTDGVAFIAMKNDGVEDSGNIYFGDPEYGTLEQMNAFMYAENNFYDTNLEASGSSSVQVDGTISAGNQVLIERDYGSHHTQLIANSDPRIESGEFELPGIPGLSGGRVTAYPVVSRRRIAVPVP